MNRFTSGIGRTAVLFLSIAGLSLGGEPLDRSTPEQQSVSSAQISEFVKKADSQFDSLHSIMILRHGKVIAEGWWKPYAAESKHELYSLSKSFTSTAIGLAVGDRLLNLDDEVYKMFPEDLPSEASNNLKAMRVRDLLTMSTGHESEPQLKQSENWPKTFLSHNVEFKPGTHFLYNTPATYMLSAILQKKTGTTLLEYLTPRLFEPLGIEAAVWGTCPQGRSLGGYGLSIRTEDIAKFGQLYLQKGRWKDKQLIAPVWIEMATAKQTSNGSNPNSDWDQGYGFQFWRCRNGHFRGDGAFGQYCVVMPQYDTVVAITSGVKDMQSVLNLIWTDLVPALQYNPIPQDDDSADGLRQILSSLTLGIPQGDFLSKEIGPWLGKEVVFEPNAQKISRIEWLQADSSAIRLRITIDGEIEQLECKANVWTEGTLRVGETSVPMATAAAWKSESHWVMKVCYRETPFVQTYDFRFNGNALEVSITPNVGFGGTKTIQCVGERK